MFDYTPDYTPVQQIQVEVPCKSSDPKCDRRTELETKTVIATLYSSELNLDEPVPVALYEFSTKLEIDYLSDRYSITEKVIRDNENAIWNQGLKAMEVYGFNLKLEPVGNKQEEFI